MSVFEQQSHVLYIYSVIIDKEKNIMEVEVTYKSDC